MSGLNTYFVPLTILQEQFWDKLTDAPLAGGVLKFFQDEARTVPKNVYALPNTPPDYPVEYTSLGSTITLSSIGTVDDGSGNNLVIYGYPYDDEQYNGSGDVQLYYMEAYSSNNQSIVSALPVNAGLGYTVGDVLTIVNTQTGSNGTVTVATISGGGGTGPIATVIITTPGYGYSNSTYSVSGGTGAGATLAVTIGTGLYQFQFSVGGFPNVPVEEAPPSPSSTQEKNFIKNGQFVVQNSAAIGAVTGTEVNFAYPNASGGVVTDGWYYVRTTGSSTDTLSFYQFPSPIDNPTGNPRYAVGLACSSANSGDTLKCIEYRFKDVNRFSDPTQMYSFFFSGYSNSSNPQNVYLTLFKFFGTGGSPSPSVTSNINLISTGSNTVTLLANTWDSFPCNFTFGSNVTPTPYVLGTNNDDYCAIRVNIVSPGSAIFNIRLTDFVLYLGNETIPAYPFTPDSYNDLQISNIQSEISTIQSYIPTSYSAMLSTAVILNASTTAWQDVTGVSITITQPGTYLISYFCDDILQTSGGNYAYTLGSQIYNVTAGAPLFTIPQNYVGPGSGNFIGATNSLTYPVVITVPTTLKLQAKISVTSDSLGFSVSCAGITAVLLGPMA